MIVRQSGGQTMRLESSLTPWSEPPHPGFFRAPEQFVDAANKMV